MIQAPQAEKRKRVNCYLKLNFRLKGDTHDSFMLTIASMGKVLVLGSYAGPQSLVS